MSFPEGWDGTSLKEHVENAQRAAGDSYDLAQRACDELETLKDEVDEGLEANQEIRGDLDTLKADFASIAAFTAPGTMAHAERMAVDDLAKQIKTLCMVLSNLYSQSTGDGVAQHSHAESVGFGVRAFCDPLAMQARGSIGPDFGDGNE